MSRLVQQMRERVDIVPGAHQPKPMRAGVVAMVALALLLVVAFGGWRPWAGGGQMIRAEFATADQLVPGRTPVRIAGVKVGTVDSLEPTPDRRHAVVVMKLDDVDVRRDAAASIRLRTILAGTRYIDLEPGSPSAPPIGDETIPPSRTTSQVDWEDVTQPYGPEIRKAQRATLNGLRGGLATPSLSGRTLDVTGPALAMIGRGVRPLRGQNSGDLRRLVDATGRTMDALSRDRGALERLIEGGARALAVTDAHRRSLGEAVELSPAALDSTTVTMRRLDTTLGHLDPLVDELRPGARELAPATSALRPALAETNKLLYAARPTLRALPPALDSLAAAGREGVPLIEDLEPTVKRTQDDLLPWLAERDEDTDLRNYEAVGPFFSTISSAAGDFDARGWFLHFPVNFTGDSVPVLPCEPGLTPPQTIRCRSVNSLATKMLGGGG